jgi:hypothetical protein
MIFLVVLLCAACGSSVSEPSSASGPPMVSLSVPATLPAQRSESFLSLLPACACNRTVLSTFSLEQGTRLHTLGAVQITGNADLATPATDSAGRVFLTVTTGARCELSGTFAECPKIAPNSCTNRVEAVGPGAGHSRTLFTVPGAETVARAVPNPSGTEVALSMTACTNPHGRSSLEVRDLRTGTTRTVASSANRCDAFNDVSWNTAGTQLVFPYDRAHGQGGEEVGSLDCPGALTDRLAVESLRRPAPQRRWTLLAPDRGCQFESAAFDQAGVVAAEGCVKGGPAGFDATNLGEADLLQYGAGHKLVHRFALKRGLEESLVAAIPHTGDVLVTQDQPANNSTPEDDWVWQLHRGSLRMIDRYKADDAPQVIAVPW